MLGSDWIRLDQVGSGWIRLDQIGLMVEAWHMARYGDKKQHYQPLPWCLEPWKRREVIDIAGLVVSMPAQRKRNAPKKKKRQRTPVFLAGGSSMVQYSNSGQQIPTTFLAMLQDSGEPLLSPPKIPICIINCSWLVIVIYCNKLLCVPMMVIHSYCLFVLFWFFFIMSYCVMDVFCIYKLYIALHSQKRHAVQEKPQIDEVESRLRTAINLQETGALLKAIKLAKRWGSKLGTGRTFGTGPWISMDLRWPRRGWLWSDDLVELCLVMFSWYMLIHGDTKSCNHWSILKYTRIQ